MFPQARQFALWLRAAALACLVAQFALCTANLWHHHDEDDPHAGADSCAVCAAVISEKSDGLPPPLIAPCPPRQVGVLQARPAPDRSVGAVALHLARGPPRPVA